MDIVYWSVLAASIVAYIVWAIHRHRNGKD
jgi:hypothetical protein